MHTHLQFVFPPLTLAANPLHHSVRATEAVRLTPVNDLGDGVVYLKEVVMVMVMVVVHVLWTHTHTTHTREGAREGGGRSGATYS